MKEVVYDLETFKRLLDPSKRVHYHSEATIRGDITADVTNILEGLTSDGLILRFERHKRITFDEVVAHAQTTKKQGNAFRDLDDLIAKNFDDWKAEASKDFNATPGRYENNSFSPMACL